MGVEQLGLYRFVCEGEACQLQIGLGGEANKSPAMPGEDPGEAAHALEPLGWYVPKTDSFDFDEILCPQCANDQATRADIEFNKQMGFKNAANQPTTDEYDPEQRRLWGKLTVEERRALHPSRLGRVATIEDARRIIAERENNL